VSLCGVKAAVAVQATKVLILSAQEATVMVNSAVLVSVDVAKNRCAATVIVAEPFASRDLPIQNAEAHSYCLASQFWRSCSASFLLK
jgi:hypothetical protein